MGLSAPTTAVATSGPYTTYVRQATGTGIFAGASASCDAGDIIVGGGATHSGGTIPAALLASRPDAGSPPTSWGARYAGGDASTQISVVAVCAHVPAGLVTTYVRQATGTGTFAGASAACDPGDVVTGGGATHIGGTVPNAMVASRPDAGSPPVAWGARYVGGDASTQISVVAICAHTSGTFTTYVRQATATGVFAGTSVPCDTGDVITGGGATHIGGTIPTALVATRPDAGSPPLAWGARYVGGDASTQISVVAVCGHLT
jgi:hypothetical protein